MNNQQLEKLSYDVAYRVIEKLAVAVIPRTSKIKGVPGLTETEYAKHMDKATDSQFSTAPSGTVPTVNAGTGRRAAAVNLAIGASKKIQGQQSGNAMSMAGTSHFGTPPKEALDNNGNPISAFKR